MKCTITVRSVNFASGRQHTTAVNLQVALVAGSIGLVFEVALTHAYCSGPVKF